MRPLTEPMKSVIRMLADKRDPIDYFLVGQLRFIFAGLERRGLIRRLDDIHGSVVLTPAGRNYVTQMKRESGENATK